MAYNDDENPYGDEYEYGDDGRDYKNLGHLEDAIEGEDQTYKDLEALDKKVKEWEDKQKRNEKKAEEVSSKAKRVVSNSKKNKAKINEIKKELSSDAEFGDNGNVIGHTPTYRESTVEFNENNVGDYSPFAFLDDIETTVRRYKQSGLEKQIFFKNYLSKQLKVMGAGQGIDTLNMISEDNDDWLSRNDGSGLFIVFEKLKENFGKIGGVFDNDINPLKDWDASKDISPYSSKNVGILYELLLGGGINDLISGVYKKLPRMKDNSERVDWDAYKELKEKGDPLHDVYTNLHYILGISNSLKNMRGGMNEKSFQYIADDYFSKYGNRLPLDSEQFKRAYNRAPKPETDTFHLDEVLSEIAKGGNVHVSDVQKGLQAFGFPYEELSKDPDFISRLKAGQLFGEPILEGSSNSKYSSSNEAELLLEILNKLEGGNSVYDRLLEVLNGEVGDLMKSKKDGEKVPEEVLEKGELIKALALEYSDRDEKGTRFDLGNDSIKWAEYMPQLIKIYEDITGEKFDRGILPQEPKKSSDAPLNEVTNNSSISLKDIGELDKIAKETNLQIKTLRIAIYKAIHLLEEVFGVRVTKRGSGENINDPYDNKGDKVVSYGSDTDDYKSSKDVHGEEASARAKRINRTTNQINDANELRKLKGQVEDFEEVLKNIKDPNAKKSIEGKINSAKKRINELETQTTLDETDTPKRLKYIKVDDVDLLKKELNFDKDTEASYDELVAPLKKEREWRQEFYNKYGLEPTKKRLEEIDKLLTIFEDISSKGDPTRFQQAFSEMLRTNPNLEGVDITEVLTNPYLWDARDNEGMFSGDVKGVMSQALGQLSNSEMDALFSEVTGHSVKINELADKVRIGLYEHNGGESNVEYLKGLRDQDMVRKELHDVAKEKSPDLEKNEMAIAHFATELSKINEEAIKVRNNFELIAQVPQHLRDNIGWEGQDYGIGGQGLFTDLVGSSKPTDVSGLGHVEAIKDTVTKTETPIARAQSSLSKFAWQFDRATYSATQLNGVVTKLFAIVGSGSAVNDMITASSLRQTNQIMLASRRGMEEAEKLYDRIQMLVVKLPGNDTFLTNILTMLGTMDESLTAEDLEYMGGIIADYYMGAQAKGQFNNETERELRNYLMTGQTRNLTNSIIASEVESLKNLNSVKERTIALEKALQKTGMDSIAHYKSYHNTLEEFKGRFQKSFADLGDLYLGFLQGLMEVYNFLDSISGSFLSQLTISLGVFALGALGLTVVLAQLVMTLSGTIDSLSYLEHAIVTGEGLEGKYGMTIRKTIAWIMFKTKLINEETASEVINTRAKMFDISVEGIRQKIIQSSIYLKIKELIAEVSLTNEKGKKRLADIQEISTTISNTIAKQWEIVTIWLLNGALLSETRTRYGGIGAKLDEIKTTLALIATNVAYELAIIGVTLATWGLVAVGLVLQVVFSPIGVLILGIVSAIYLLIKGFESLGQAFGWWKDIGGMFQAIGDGLHRTWEAFINSKPIQDIIHTFQNFAYTLEVLFRWISRIGGNIWQTIFGIDGGGTRQVFDIVGAFLELVGAIGNLIYWISPLEEILGIFDAIGSTIAWFLDTWNEFVDSDEMQEVIRGFQDIREIFGEAWSTLASAYDEVRKAFLSIFENEEELEDTKEGMNILLEILKAIAKLISLTIVPLLKTVATIFKGIAVVVKTVADIFSWFIGLFTNTEGYIGNFGGMIQQLATFVVGEFLNIPSRIMEGINGGIINALGMGGLLGDTSNLSNQKQLAQTYSNKTNNTTHIINNNFHEGSVQADARNMSAKDVRTMFTNAFGFNNARGINGVIN